MINILVSTDSRYHINRALVRSVVLATLEKHSVGGKIEIGVNIVGDRKMHELNRKYRGIEGTTDILSFALEDSNPVSLQHIPRVGFVASPDSWLRLGDIVISYPQVVEDASFDGISIDEEIEFLLEHGVKHLLGIHHQESN